MKMSQSAGAKLSAISRLEMLKRIDEYGQQYRPKVIGQYEENGHTITVIGAAHAENCGCHQYVKTKGRSGAYDL